MITEMYSGKIISVQSAQECDATGDAISTAARCKIKRYTIKPAENLLMAMTQSPVNKYKNNNAAEASAAPFIRSITCE